jgi:hypothetical protein
MWLYSELVAVSRQVCIRVCVCVVWCGGVCVVCVCAWWFGGVVRACESAREECVEANVAIQILRFPWVVYVSRVCVVWMYALNFCSDYISCPNQPKPRFPLFLSSCISVQWGCRAVKYSVV